MISEPGLSLVQTTVQGDLQPWSACTQVAHGDSLTNRAQPEPRPRLVVFADDWGRHASSAQHLIGKLLDTYTVDWVNTVGTRMPRLDLADTKRVFGKFARWFGRSRVVNSRLTIHDPWMWPGFRTRLARSMNARLLREQLLLALFREPEPIAIVTTHPLVADLARLTPNLNWVYYCVDALDHWPGLDHATLSAMEKDLLRLPCTVIASSAHLIEKFRSMGRDAHELTHGVDPDHWAVTSKRVTPSPHNRPVALYFGCIDRRLDARICTALASRLDLVLIGPISNADPVLARTRGIAIRGPLSMDELPAAAAEADVLVMPYADIEATRAMQPLKLKEYLATGKPVVATPLPSTLAWRDALDLSDDPVRFAEIAASRAGRPLDVDQAIARRRLEHEHWNGKARRFQQLLPRHRKVPVLHVRICQGRGSGPESVILPSPRQLAGSRFTETAAIVHNADDADIAGLAVDAIRNECPLELLPERWPLDLSPLLRLRRICRQQSIRIWHSHDYKSNLFGLLLRRHFGFRLVTTVHGWVHHTWKTPLYHAIDRWCLRRFDRVIVVSQELFNRCVDIGVAPERLRLIENAVDVDRYGRAPVASESESRCDSTSPIVIGALGRLEPEKGFDVLVEAVERLMRQGVDIKLLIAGTGGQHGALTSRMDRSIGSRRMRLVGWVPDAASFLTDVDIVAVPSRREGCPLVLLESMALSKPIVATTVGGIPRVVIDGVHGALVPPDDPAALASALRRLVEDPDLRRSFASAARQRAPDS